MNENCRGEDVFIIQSTSFPANDNLMELLILIDTLKELQQKELQLLFPITDMLDKTENLVHELQ